GVGLGYARIRIFVRLGVWRDRAMRGVRFELLAASALAIVLTAASGLPAAAGMTEDKAIEARVPIPQSADLPPPSAADIGAPAAAASPRSIDVETRIPLPEVADVPPPSLEDVGGPATAATDTKTPEPAARPSQPATRSIEPAKAAEPAATPAEAAPAKDIAAQPPAAAPVEDPVTVALRDMIGTKLARMVDRKNERSAIETFYVKRA